MKKCVRPLFVALSFSLLMSACGGYSPVGGSNGNTARPAGWEALTHSNDAAPDYRVVFPQNQVNRLDITIKPADWKLMQEDMTQLFGTGQGGPGGGFGGGMPPGAPPAGWPPPEGFPEGWTPPGPNATPDPNATPRPFPSGRPMGGGPGGPGGGGMLEMEENPIYRPATVQFQGKTWTQVGIRYKGNSSLRSSWGRTLKMPLRFDFDEFENEYPEIKNQRFYGFKRLTLSSGFSDDSLIREKVAADIFRAAGVPAAQTAFYRVYLDYGEGSKYLGLYTLVEVPDTPMLSAQFGAAGGNLYKPSGTGAMFGSFNQEHFAKKSNETTSDWSDVQAVFSALHASRSDAAKWRDGLERVFDVDGFLKYLAVNTLIQNWDTYGRMAHNYYLYTDPKDGKIHWIPWDHNMSLSGGMGGGMGGMRPIMAQPSPSASASPNPNTTFPGWPGGMGGPGGGSLSLALSASEVGDNWPLIRFLADDPVYRAKYNQYVRETANGAFAIGPTQARYQAAHDLIKAYVVGPEGEQPEATMLSSTSAFESSVNELVTHLQGRHAAAETYLAGQP